MSSRSTGPLSRVLDPLSRMVATIVALCVLFSLEPFVEGRGSQWVFGLVALVALVWWLTQRFISGDMEEER